MLSGFDLGSAYKMDLHGSHKRASLQMAWEELALKAAIELAKNGEVSEETKKELRKAARALEGVLGGNIPTDELAMEWLALAAYVIKMNPEITTVSHKDYFKHRDFFKRSGRNKEDDPVVTLLTKEERVAQEKRAKVKVPPGLEQMNAELEELTSQIPGIKERGDEAEVEEFVDKYLEFVMRSKGTGGCVMRPSFEEICKFHGK